MVGNRKLYIGTTVVGELSFKTSTHKRLVSAFSQGKEAPFESLYPFTVDYVVLKYEMLIQTT